MRRLAGGPGEDPPLHLPTVRTEASAMADASARVHQTEDVQVG